MIITGAVATGHMVKQAPPFDDSLFLVVQFLAAPAAEPALAGGSTATLDEGFMKDVEEGVTRRSQPWTPPTWE